MATIENLTKSFLDLSLEEQHSFIHALRQSRRTPPTRIVKRSKTANSKSSKRASTKSLLNALSPEDTAALIEMLERELL